MSGKHNLLNISDDAETNDSQLSKELSQCLEGIPPEYRVDKFNPLPSVVKVLEPQLADSRDQKIEQVEEHLESLEQAMNLIVDGENSSVL
jgi:hypothetical protein